MLSRRTPVTAVLLAAIGAGYLLQVLLGDGLTALGANYGPSVRQGEVWRLATSLFLHGGFVHLAVNAWGLYQLGELFEILLGSRRLLLVYFVSGLSGSLSSVLFNHEPSVGASGAIFGVLGTLIAFLFRHREILTPGAKSLLSQLLLWAGLNIVLGFSMAGIDNAGHLGGCVAGLLIGFALRPLRPRPSPALPLES